MLKKYLFLGFEKSTLQKCKKQLDADNIRTVKNVSILLMVILLVLLFFYMMFDNEWIRNLICFASICFLIGEYFICRYLLKHPERIKPGIADFLIDFFSYFCIMVGIYLGTFAADGGMAVAPVWMFFFVILIFNRFPMRNLIVLSISGTLYVVCCYLTKDQHVFHYDMIHGVTSIFASLYMAWSKSRMKMENILALQRLQKMNLEILEVAEEQGRKASQLRSEVRFDGLTGLYNKKAFEEAVREAIETGGEQTACALICLDIDDFKKINDSLGHLGGDEVLKKIGNLIQIMFRKNDVAGRFGGDEFTIFLRDIPDTRMAADKVIELLKRTKSEHDVSISAGIAIFPESGRTYFELFEHADAALYHAKKAGKNISCLYTNHMMELKKP